MRCTCSTTRRRWSRKPPPLRHTPDRRPTVPSAKDRRGRRDPAAPSGGSAYRQDGRGARRNEREEQDRGRVPVPDAPQRMRDGRRRAGALRRRAGAKHPAGEHRPASRRPRVPHPGERAAPRRRHDGSQGGRGRDGADAARRADAARARRNLPVAAERAAHAAGRRTGAHEPEEHHRPARRVHAGAGRRIATVRHNPRRLPRTTVGRDNAAELQHHRARGHEPGPAAPGSRDDAVRAASRHAARGERRGTAHRDRPVGEPAKQPTANRSSPGRRAGTRRCSTWEPRETPSTPGSSSIR